MKITLKAFTGHRMGAQLLVAILATFVWQTSQAADLRNVMPMGDSITLGSNITGGYRDPLHTLLNNRGDTFTFVGSLTGSATTALTSAGQVHHEGHSGFVIIDGGDRSGLDDELVNWIGPSGAAPDKILLMIGSNDINLGYDMVNAPNRLSTLITHIYDYRPNVKLYVASIIPMVGHETDVQAFNAAIPGIVASHRALGKDIVYVPMYESLDINTDLADGLHPNALGYQHMADAWDTALHSSSTHALPGQQILSLSGWNIDIIVGAAETAPGYNGTMADWNYYETGLSGSTQGLASNSGGAPRTFTSSYNPSVQFQFAPYDGNNSVYLAGNANATLTLNDPTTFYSLQFLMTARNISWYAKLNFADGSNTTTPIWSDPDWTVNPGPTDRCLSSYGLKNIDGSFYPHYLWMAERDFTLSSLDQLKTLESITFYTTGNYDQQLALFAVSGYVLDSPTDTFHAADITAGADTAGGSSYSVGWDFTVSQTIKITSLGQFDPDSNPKSNSVAIYQRGGAKLIEAALLANSPSELSGIYSARYVAINDLVLSPGNYVVFSTQNGDNFAAGGATLGPAIKWNMGVALSSGSAAGPLPAAAPASWPIQDSTAWRYFGPTFKYELVVPPPTVTITSPTNNQVLSVSRYISANVTVANPYKDYTVHVYTNNGTGTFGEVGTGGTHSPYLASLGKLPIGTYQIYASVTNTLTTVTTATNTFTVALITGQQTVDLTGWNQDIIIGTTEPPPGYSASIGWNFYENGLLGSTQGLPPDSGGTNRTFTSSYTPSVQFQFAPYTGNNAVFLAGAGNATLTLVNPAKFYSLQFLMTTRSISWYAILNFADGSSTTTPTWSDTDWVADGPADTCLTNYGLKNTNGSYFTTYTWMAERGFKLSTEDQTKTLNSITFYTTQNGDQHFMLFAVSGYALSSSSDIIRAVDLLTAGDGPGGGNAYSVGWDFTVTQTITLTSLGQFDPNTTAVSNTVAIYQRGGAKLAQAAVLTSTPATQSGNYSARYATIDELVLPPGDYVVFSTQNGNDFIAGGGNPTATLGPAIIWNMGVALDGLAAGPVPETAPDWPLKTTSKWRYFGPTFQYKLEGVIPPKGLIIIIR